MMLHVICVREEAEARNRAFFRVKWVQPAMKGGWRAAHACSRNEKGFIFFFKVKSTPPRTGATGNLIFIKYYFLYQIKL